MKELSWYYSNVESRRQSIISEDINVSDPHSIRICEGVYWKPLGQGIKCQITTRCSNLALKTCDRSVRFMGSVLWKGCQRQFCLEHAEIKIYNDGVQKRVHTYCCKDGPCCQSFNHAYQERYRRLQYTSIACIFLILILYIIIL